MSFDLDGKAAIVTGGATLIGDRVVAELVRAGAKVVSADINREEGQRRADEYGDRVVFSATDVTVDPQLEDLVQLCFDSLVESTFLSTQLPPTSTTAWKPVVPTGWRPLMSISFSGAILTAKVAPHMERRGGGSIINFASTSGKRATHFSFV